MPAPVQDTVTVDLATLRTARLLRMWMPSKFRRCQRVCALRSCHTILAGNLNDRTSEEMIMLPHDPRVWQHPEQLPTPPNFRTDGEFQTDPLGLTFGIKPPDRKSVV